MFVVKDRSEHVTNDAGTQREITFTVMGDPKRHTWPSPSTATLHPSPPPVCFIFARLERLKRRTPSAITIGTLLISEGGECRGGISASPISGSHRKSPRPATRNPPPALLDYRLLDLHVDLSFVFERRRVSMFFWKLGSNYSKLYVIDREFNNDFQQPVASSRLQIILESTLESRLVFCDVIRNRFGFITRWAQV